MNGRKPVMFDRALRPEWIDYALARSRDARDDGELRADLQAWMAQKDLGAFTSLKTVRQLVKIVGARTPLSPERLDTDYELLQRLSPDNRNAVRLQLVYDSTDFFADTVKVIRALHMNGSASFTASELYERVQAAYGHRGTIPRRVRSVLQTLASFGCLVNSKHRWSVIPGSWLDCGLLNKPTVVARDAPVVSVS